LVLFCFWFPFFPFFLQFCTMCECPRMSFRVLRELFFFVHFVVNCLFNNLLGFKKKRKRKKKK
jgi:quinol-cytochrome oxidoreductase complex cytochrome b subunit